MQLYHCWAKLNIQLQCIMWLYEPVSPPAHESLFLICFLVLARTSLQMCELGVQSETVVILYLTISSIGSWAVIGREPSNHMAKGILPNGEVSSLTPFGVISKFWTLQTFGWTSLFFHFEALSQETSGQLWSLNYKGGFKTFFLPTPWNQLSSRTFLEEVCLECDKQHEQTQKGDGVT